MPSRNGFDDLARSTEGSRSAPILGDTYWGYVVRPAEPFLERAALTEIVSSFAGVLLLFSGWVHWLLPGLTGGGYWLRLAITAVFLLLGTVLLWAGRSGLVQEMHVDTSKAELRLVQRNRHGDGRLNTRIRFSEVASVLILPPRVPAGPARLCLRLQSGRLIELLGAPEETLLPIRDRLIGDLSPRFRSSPEVPRRVPMLSRTSSGSGGGHGLGPRSGPGIGPAQGVGQRPLRWPGSRPAAPVQAEPAGRQGHS